MKIICTTCSKEKVEESATLPAWKRYVSPRINSIREIAHASNLPFFILSGKMGLIHEDAHITYYDYILTESDVERLVPLVKEQIEKNKITHIIFYSKPKEGDLIPYYTLLERSTADAKILFEIKTLT